MRRLGKTTLATLLSALLLPAVVAGCGQAPSETPELTLPTYQSSVKNSDGTVTVGITDAQADTAFSNDSTAATGATAALVTTNAAGTNGIQTMIPATKAAGTKATTGSNEGAALFRAVQAIFRGGTFTLKGRASSDLPGSSGGLLPAIWVADGNRLALQTTPNMTSLLKASGANTANAAMLELMLGKTFRQVVAEDKVLYVFPDRRVYLDMTGKAAAIPSVSGNIARAQGDIKTTNETIGGRAYLCATAKDPEGVIWRLFFAEGELARIEKIDGGKRTVIEVDSLVSTADAKYFSTDGMITLDLSKLG